MLHQALRQITANALSSLRPPPPLTVSSWADTHRRLSPEASAEPGQWRTSRAEYQRGILDAFNDPKTHTVVVMSSAQVGKTEILNNLVAFFVAHEPAPVLVLQPTLEMSEAWSKDRLAPMLRDTPELAGKVKDARSRDSGNTLLHKSFPGGHITMAGANSPASLASRPIRVFVADEVDRYPKSAGTEGDPVKLGSKRTATFWNRRIGLFSTPTIKGASRIETAFFSGDQRYYHVSCPHCEHEQKLRWAQVRWSASDGSDARYACEGCGVLLTDGERYGAIKRGRWIAAAAFKGIASFHLSELYSPWRRLTDTVADFLEAKVGGPEMLKVWTNTALGETWEQAGGDKLDPNALQARAEQYEALTIPDERATYLTVGVDTQNDRLAVKIVGWGRGEESWLVLWAELFGDPQEQDVWNQLEELLNREFLHPNGRAMAIKAVGLDTGGSRTQFAYDWVRRARQAGLPVYALKGSSDRAAPTFGRPKKVDITLKGREVKGGVELYMVGTHTIKDVLAARLRSGTEGNGKVHFYDAGPDYFEQMTSEVAKQKYSMGQLYYVWEKVKKDARNEAWDTMVYAMAAAYIAGLKRANWDLMDSYYRVRRRTAVLDDGAPVQVPAEEAPPPVVPKKKVLIRRSGGVGGLGGLVSRRR